MSTHIGKDTWNRLRRKIPRRSAWAEHCRTDSEYGGPVMFHQLREISLYREPARRLVDADDHHAERQQSSTASSPLEPQSTSLGWSNVHFRTTLGDAEREAEDEVSPLPAASPRDPRRNLRWAERPRWLRDWFLTRPHLAGPAMLDLVSPEYASQVPAYTSRRNTLPLYNSSGA